MPASSLFPAKISPSAMRMARREATRVSPNPALSAGDPAICLFHRVQQKRSKGVSMTARNKRNATAGAVDASRRCFLQGSALAGAAGLAAAMGAFPATAAEFAGTTLQVWSCGGLAEAMMPAHEEYERLSGTGISYTGAFAAVLGKSLMGSGRTEVFCGRGLELSRNLKKAGRMLHFVPLCYTGYVIVTPRGNPAKITAIEDLAKPGVRVAIAPEASPPGGAAVMGILKKAGLDGAVMANAAHPGTCVQSTVESVADGDKDAMIVELRIPRMPRFADRLEIVPLPFALFPPGPLTFTAGMMQEAKNPELANHYIDWLVSAQGGGRHFERAGFIPADSEEGRKLTEQLGVKDV
jgi:molybdate transport system substrate-binding protein